jgi:hypothetical protein
MERRGYLKTQGILIGGIFFSGSIIAFLSSCKKELQSNWKSNLLTEEQLAITAELAELIIPRTDTPGAKDVEVHKRIDEVLYHSHESEEQRMFIDGLQRVNDISHSILNKKFMKGSSVEREQVLQALVVDSQNNKNEFFKHIYPFIKGLTLVAYFTSEKIGKEVLMYDPIPGEFKGKVPLSEIGGIWSLK